MPVSKFTCPECETVLRPAKPLPSGKRVTCPKCKAQFTVRDPDEEAKPAKSAKKPAAPAAKNDPFADDGPDTYAVIKEEEPKEELEDEEDEDEDEDRPRKPKKPKKDARMEDLEFRVRMDAPDPRGPAQAALISPSNFLMLVGTLACLVGVGAIAYGAWPFLFTEDILSKEEFFGVTQGKDSGSDTEQKTDSKQKQRKIQVEEGKVVWNDRTPSNEDKEAYYKARDEKELWLIIYMVAGGVVLVYNAFVIIGGVKMQNMESYTWAMVASIMAFVLSFPGLGQLAGLLALTTLRSKKVVDGFFYIPPSATPHARQKKKEVL